jgi:hypothetical protein
MLFDDLMSAMPVTDIAMPNPVMQSPVIGEPGMPNPFAPDPFAPDPDQEGLDPETLALILLLAVPGGAPPDAKPAPTPAPPGQNLAPDIVLTINGTFVNGKFEYSPDKDVSDSQPGYTINGDKNANRITGTAFRDHIYGNGGDDVIDGGGGNDLITGGAGNDTLTGGAGGDTFRYHDGDGNDVITDFKPGEDKLDFLINNFDAEALLKNGKQVGNDFVITIPMGGSVTLKDVDGTKLTVKDFGWINADVR